MDRRGFLLAAGFVGFAGALSLTGCSGGKPEPVPSDDHAEDIAAVVYVGDNFYEPEMVTVKPGQAVRWEWVGKEEHDVVSNDRTFVTPLQREGKYVHIFDEPGDYAYICSIHPEMRGVIEVAE